MKYFLILFNLKYWLIPLYNTSLLNLIQLLNTIWIVLNKHYSNFYIYCQCRIMNRNKGCFINGIIFFLFKIGCNWIYFPLIFTRCNKQWDTSQHSSTSTNYECRPTVEFFFIGQWAAWPGSTTTSTTSFVAMTDPIKVETKPVDNKVQAAIFWWRLFFWKSMGKEVLLSCALAAKQLINK